ncbi:hypothetical protein AB0J57_12935 [Streptomyces sp. NPDC049837]|uniref:hypothetical protein n=1 Tax=Streptomyces sp. NPDC049837 TaxID=3155277 RepID=UPI0034210383
MREFLSSGDSYGTRDPWTPVNGTVSVSISDLERQVTDLPATATSPESWEQLRDWCVGRMQSPVCSAALRARWGHLALIAISRQHKAGTDDAQKAVADTARIRAYMIQELGVSASDEARQPAALCAYVLESIGLPIDEVTRLAGEWRTAPREQALLLRRLKNMLTPLVHIQDLVNPDDAVRHEITPWLALIPKLP